MISGWSEREIVCVIFDFDGVILESNRIRKEGFLELLSELSLPVSDAVIDYLGKSAGVSRYKKIKQIFNAIYCEEITEQRVMELAQRYSSIVFDKLLTVPYVDGVEEFIAGIRTDKHLFIVSASDEKELNRLCNQRGLTNNFTLILGSPEGKARNIEKIIEFGMYNPQNIILIGDTYQDWQAADSTGIHFLPRASGEYDWNGQSGLSAHSFVSYAEIMQFFLN